MVVLSDLKPFKLEYKELENIAYYYWMSEYVLTHFLSDEYSIEVKPEIPGFGAHWGGLFVAVKDKDGVQKALCHTGLVYHPKTEIGIYFETESWKNAGNYSKLWRDVASEPGYELNKDESDFIKFFLPKDKVVQLMNAQSIEEQMAILSAYYDACFTGILKAANK